MSDWPEIRLSSFSSESVAEAERQKKKARRQKARQESLNALMEAQSAAGRSSYSAVSMRNMERNRLLREEIKGRLRSPEFKLWYELTTGEPVESWLDDTLMAEDDYRRRFPNSVLGLWGWIEFRIRLVAEKNPWTNPEMRAYWGRELNQCRDPARRRLILLNLATPRWANREKIAAIYADRARIEVETGIAHDVDHIIPIVNQRVCGLHWEGNLRVIPAADNRSKSNRFDSEQFLLDILGANSQ